MKDVKKEMTMATIFTLIVFAIMTILFVLAFYLGVSS